jgi:thioredoxin reductase (NADPH)
VHAARTTCLHEVGVELDARGFAVGDVRAGSVKRVASAVGEGSVVVSAVHSHLAAGTKTP